MKERWTGKIMFLELGANQSSQAFINRCLVKKEKRVFLSDKEGAVFFIMVGSISLSLGLLLSPLLAPGLGTQ